MESDRELITNKPSLDTNPVEYEMHTIMPPDAAVDPEMFIQQRTQEALLREVEKTYLAKLQEWTHF